ncbi:MAG: hypothetical protein LBO62_01525 [Endomicrobium sp.]|nr:hypothetical protein [Endomicrobium sp.]
MDIKANIVLKGTERVEYFYYSDFYYDYYDNKSVESSGYGFETDLTYWFNNHFGIGAGFEFMYRNAEHYNHYKGNMFNAFASLNARAKNFYCYANAGTRISLGAGIEISNFIVDISYNFYLADSDRIKGAQSLNLSAGYKFNLM